MKGLLDRIGALLAITVSLVALGGAATAQAQGGTPYAIRITNAYSLPTPRAALIGGIGRGQPVAMECWIDYAWVNGTNRWYLARGGGFNPYTGRFHLIRGYVNANDIGRPASVRRC